MGYAAPRPTRSGSAEARGRVPSGGAVHPCVPQWDGARRRGGGRCRMSVRRERGGTRRGLEQRMKTRPGRTRGRAREAEKPGTQGRRITDSSMFPSCFLEIWWGRWGSPRDRGTPPAGAAEEAPPAYTISCHDGTERNRGEGGRRGQRPPVVTVSRVARAVPIMVPTEASTGSHRSRSGRRARRTSRSRFSAM